MHLLKETLKIKRILWKLLNKNVILALFPNKSLQKKSAIILTQSMQSETNVVADVNHITIDDKTNQS